MPKIIDRISLNRFAQLAAAVALLAAPALSAVPCMGLKSFALGDSCEACDGVTVKKVRRGLVHGVEVNGLFWTDASVEGYSNAAAGGKAEEVCRSKNPGLRLPTKKEIETLGAQLYRDGERACSALNAVMPDSVGRHMWTSSPDTANPKRAWMYWGTSNNPELIDRGASGAVRCVGNVPDAPAPPTDHAAAATGAFVRGPYQSCVDSMTQDAGADAETAADACKTQYAPAFYRCVDHLANSGSALKTAIDACLRNSSPQFVTCAVKNRGAGLDQCMKTPAAAPEGDASKLDRYIKSCDAGNLFGCVLAGKGRAKAGDAAGAARDFKKACDGKFQPGCEALAAQSTP